MFVAYTANIRGIIECWQCYGVYEDYNGVVSKVLGDKWINLQILSIQSLEAHHRIIAISLGIPSTTLLSIALILAIRFRYRLL